MAWSFAVGALAELGARLVEWWAPGSEEARLRRLSRAQKGVEDAQKTLDKLLDEIEFDSEDGITDDYF